MVTSPIAALRELAVGSTCEVELIDHTWALVFTRSAERTCAVTTDSLWRLEEGGQIVMTSDDHGQSFGLAAPLDGVELCRAVLADKPIVGLAVRLRTGDLLIDFSEGARLEVLTTSCGYENWQAAFRSDGEEVVLVAGGGGALSWASSPAGSQPSLLQMRPLGHGA